MSGYREHGFDPNAYEQPGPPLKPYNWVQWTGAALGLVGAALITLSLLGKVGLIPRWIDTSPAPFTLLVIGMVLINSRRAPATQVGSEQLEKNRRVLLITAAICAAVLGAAAVIEFSGAN
jgi:hypothetical protein